MVPNGETTKEIIAKLFKENYDKMVLMAYNYVGHQAEDIVSDTLVKFLKLSPERFKKIECLESYFFTAVKNRCINVLKKGLKQQKSLEGYAKTVEDSEQTMENTSTPFNLETLLKALTKKQSEAIGLFLEGYSNEEIRDKMGLKSTNAAKNLVFRAREKLKEKLLHSMQVIKNNLDNDGDDDGNGGAIAMPIPIPDNEKGIRYISMNDITVDLLQDYFGKRLLPSQRRIVEYAIVLDDICFEIVQGMHRYLLDHGAKNIRDEALSFSAMLAPKRNKAVDQLKFLSLVFLD